MTDDIETLAEGKAAVAEPEKPAIEPQTFMQISLASGQPNFQKPGELVDNRMQALLFVHAAGVIGGMLGITSKSMLEEGKNLAKQKPCPVTRNSKSVRIANCYYPFALQTPFNSGIPIITYRDQKAKIDIHFLIYPDGGDRIRKVTQMAAEIAPAGIAFGPCSLEQCVTDYFDLYYLFQRRIGLNTTVAVCRTGSPAFQSLHDAGSHPPTTSSRTIYCQNPSPIVDFPDIKEILTTPLVLSIVEPVIEKQ